MIHIRRKRGCVMRERGRERGRGEGEREGRRREREGEGKEGGGECEFGKETRGRGSTTKLCDNPLHA